jgi:hypothetical protein
MADWSNTHIADGARDAHVASEYGICWISAAFRARRNTARAAMSPCVRKLPVPPAAPRYTVLTAVALSAVAAAVDDVHESAE